MDSVRKANNIMTKDFSYLAQRKGIMLAYPLEEKRFNRWGGSCFVQPKLDGNRCRVEYDREQKSWQFLSASGDCANFAVPHLVRQFNESKLPRYLRYDGEFYTHGLALQDIASIVKRRKELHPDHLVIGFHCFDIISELTQELRFQQLSWVVISGFQPDGFFYVIPSMAFSMSTIWSQLDFFFSKGYEGIICRQIDGLYKPLDPSEKAKHSTGMMKFKPGQQDTYPVVGVKQLIDKHGQTREEFGSFICETDGRQFSVGTGLTLKQRKRLWQDYLACPEIFQDKSLSVLIKYQHLTGTKGHRQGVPYSSVLADLILTKEVPDE